MRIDKFLKSSRIIKRRTIAKEACDQEKVKINGRIAKAGDNVEIGDEVIISFGSGDLKIKVLKLIDDAKKSQADSMYEVI